MDVRAVVDRFEDGKAVLLVGPEECQVVWPRALLPAETREGDVLAVRLTVDAAATHQARAAAAALLKNLQEKTIK